MAAVTQRILNYLGGVSRQSDDRKLPGQVRECYNAYPDPTFGLVKRPGFEHVLNIGTGTTYDDGKWFYLNRDDDEEYIGVIIGSTPSINIWNIKTGATCTVTYPDGTGYLNGTKDQLKMVSIQDTSIVINSSIDVAALSVTTNYQEDRAASVVLKQFGPDSETYTITVNINSTTNTATYTTSSSDDVNSILTNLESDINAWGISGLTVTRLSNSLELTSTSDMDVSAEGGLSNLYLVAIEQNVDDISDLPSKSVHDRVLKILNTGSADDDYWVKFVAHDGVSGEGYWEETLDPNFSAGLDRTTTPHELVNTAVDTFIFRQIPFEPRSVGDDTTNPQPSFVGNKITAGFYHNNRLGFLSNDNVIMSRSGDFFNFYNKTAQTALESDPIDISCSSIRPTALHAVIPVAQGVILFSSSQQFLMFSDTGVLSPTTSTIRTISNYEVNKNIDPVDVGTNISFASKTPGYSRVFGMVTKGQQMSPQVLDISRVVKEWISPDIDLMIASPQNSLIAMSGQDLKEVFLFRYYNDGEKNLMESWVSWNMPGTVQFLATNTDDMYAVTKQANQFTILKTALSQSPEQAIIVNNQGQRVNPCIDLYATASSVTYNSTTKETRCYLPYNDVSDLTPIIVIKGTTQTGSFVESGFTVTPERGTDGTGDYFSITNKDLSGVASDVIVGFKYNFDVELPRTYFRPEQTQTDFTANLTIARMKFSVGLSGMMSFKLQQTGRLPYELKFTGEETVTITGNGTSGAINRVNLPTTTSGSGTGMTVDLTTSGGVVTAITINEQGSGYADSDVITVSAADAGTGTDVTGTYAGTTTFTFNKRDLDYVDRSDVKVKVNGVTATNFSFTNDTTIVFTSAPANNAEIRFYIDEWFDVQPTIEANTYLANDVPLDTENVFTLPIHQRTENFRIRMFNNSPFPVAINAMMWEGQYTPRFYRRY